MMAIVDYFLKIDGIEGESLDQRHAGEIEVLSWSWGLTSSSTVIGSTGGTTGRPTFQDISFSAAISKASPKLFVYSATGKHVPEAVLVARKVGGDQQEFYEITLKDCLVSSYQQSGSEPGIVESFSLNFAQIKVSYKAQKPDGSLDAAVEAGYDLKSNKEV